MPPLPSGERTDAHPARGVAWAGLAGLAVAMGIGRFAFTPILPMMQDDSGLSVPEGGWLASANYAGYLAGALSAIVMRVRPAVAIRLALVLIGLSTLAMSLEHRVAVWLALRAVAGVASAWVLVFVSAWALERLAALGRPVMGGAVYAGVGAGIAAAGGACLLLTYIGGRSAEAWVVLGAASLAVTAVVWPFIAVGPPPGAVETATGEQPALPRAEFWRLVLCYGAFGFGYIIPATFLPLMGKEAVPDPLLFGWAWPVFGAAAVASTLLAARMSRFLSHRKTWIAGNLAMALGVMLPVVVKGLAGILIAALLVGGTFMVITMAGMQEARRVAGARARALMAAMTSAFAVGQIIGPASVSALATATGGFAPALVAAASLLGLSALLLIDHRD
ncbi:MAG: YbfB/YjiJ family MFS transporter, partial [Pseudomonadota bacterium]